METYQFHTLPNGIRIVHKQVPYSKVAHCGIVLDIGSRDEQAHEQGIAHFWEHMAFKGTQKRKAFHILNRLEVFGGDLNAYTTKEKICFHASVLDQHFEIALELLADISFYSTFPENELRKEKGVILEEMAMYADDPADAIQDHFDELFFPEHPLGKNILGNQESVSNFTRENFFSFLQKNLHNDRIVLASVSPQPLKKVVALATKYLADVPRHEATQNRLPFQTYKPQEVRVEKRISQAHCTLGVPAYSLKDEKRLPLMLLTNILGGMGMNSRLNLILREKYGLVYSVEASYSNYLDTGMFSIYFATDKDSLEKSIQLTIKELRKLKEQSLGVLQLHRAKQQFIGQLAISEENKLNEMQMMGKTLLDFGYIESLESSFEKINALTVQELQDVANEIFDEKQLCSLIFLPEKL